MMMVNPKLLMPVLLGFIIFASSYDYAFAQTIQINETEPCFLNYTAGYKVWDNCGMDEDWMQASLIGFEWVTGGYFSLFFVGVMIMFTYIKYHKALYPLMVGLAYLPISYSIFPSAFWPGVLLLIGLTLTATIYKIVKNQTSEFN